jgi:hypothetical protein
MSVTGKWTLTVASVFTPKPFALNLTDEGNGALLGSMLEEGSSEQPQQIRNGKINGAKLSWEIVTPLPLTFSGTLNGNTITGNVTKTKKDNVPFSAPFQATRP